MGDLTRIPTRTIVTTSPATNIGLGPTKINLTPTRDPYGYEDAEEANYLRDQVIDLREKVGVDGDGFDDDSIQGQLLALGNADPGLYRYRENFEYQAAGAIDPRWTVVTGAWVTVNVARGGVRAPMDGGVEQFLRTTGFMYYRGSLPWLRIRAYWGVINGTAPIAQFGFINAAGTEGWGIEFHKGTSDFFRLYTMTGGATTYTVTPYSPVAETWHDIQVSLHGTPGAQVVTCKIDGDTASTVATVVAQHAWAAKSVIGSGAEAGKSFTLGCAWIGADYTQADA